MVSVEWSWLHDDDREHVYGSGGAAPDGVTFATALAVVLAVLLRVDGVVRVLDVLGDLLGSAIRHGQVI